MTDVMDTSVDMSPRQNIKGFDDCKLIEKITNSQFKELDQNKLETGDLEYCVSKINEMFKQNQFESTDGQDNVTEKENFLESQEKDEMMLNTEGKNLSNNKDCIDETQGKNFNQNLLIPNINNPFLDSMTLEELCERVKE